MVYVDTMRASFGRMVMCHMIEESSEELLAMADKIGLQRRWLQDAGTYREHFDVSLSTKALAIKAGAREISMRELAQKIWERRPQRVHMTVVLDDGPRAPRSPKNERPGTTRGDWGSRRRSDRRGDGV